MEKSTRAQDETPEPRCEGLAPFHCGNSDCPVHGKSLKEKFLVKKIHDPDGKHDRCRYFVLDPKHDPMAVVALNAYRIEARLAGQDELANDLADWLNTLWKERHD